MTPLNSGSNRALAGLATALGIAIGVAPRALLAQATTGTEQVPAVHDKIAIQDKGMVMTTQKEITVGAVQTKGRVAASQAKEAVMAKGVKVKTAVPAVQDKVSTQSPK